MNDLSTLTDPIIRILNKELTVLVKGKFYSTYDAFLKSLETFANFCIQDTHPEMFKLNIFAEDKELMNYLEDLRFYAVNGGFSRKSLNFVAYFHALQPNFLYFRHF